MLHDDFMGYLEIECVLTLKDGDVCVMDMTMRMGSEKQYESMRGTYDIRHGILYITTKSDYGDTAEEQRIGAIDMFAITVSGESVLSDSDAVETVLTNTTACNMRDVAYTLSVLGLLVVVGCVVILVLSKKATTNVATPKQTTTPAVPQNNFPSASAQPNRPMTATVPQNRPVSSTSTTTNVPTSIFTPRPPFPYE